LSPSAGPNYKEDPAASEIKLALAGYNSDEEACRSVEHYKRGLRKQTQRSPLEQQLYFWEK
jgi:hypothetical protein